MRAASEVRYHRVSRAASNHTQPLITFAYHLVRKILLQLRAYDRSDRSITTGNADDFETKTQDKHATAG